MLSVIIKNYALIKHAEIDLDKGFTIFTGETGAGKSIVLSAIRFVLGGKSDTKIIRTDEEECEVCLILRRDIFLEQILSENDIDQNDEILVKRVLRKNGSSKAFVCGKLVPLSTLKKISNNVIFCSQFENQKLLNPDSFMETIDSFVEEKSAYINYNNLYRELTTTEEALSDVIKLNQEKESKLDYIQFVYDEIARVNPKENEEIELEEKLNKIKDLGKTISFFELSDDYIYGDNAILSKLEKIRKLLRELSIEKELTEEIDSAIGSVEALGLRISKLKKGYGKEVDVNSIQDRLSKVKSLIRKYGGSLSSVLTKKSELKLQIERYNSIEDELHKLKEKKSEVLKKINSASKNLSEKRKIAAESLGNAITKELQELNMRGSELSILISDLGYFNDKGKDKIEVVFRPNVGEKSLPLSEIASGGELSRVTLAIYRILGNFLNTTTFVFDEIDTGIGGETASIIGEKLKSLSEEKQVISVTHLPQIAELADVHFMVKKNEINKRTESSVNLLSKEDAKEEINRMRFGLKKKEI